MAIAPNSRYLRLVCKKCGWSQVIPQMSDALLVPDQCVKCGSAEIESLPAFALEYVFDRLFKLS